MALDEVRHGPTTAETADDPPARGGRPRRAIQEAPPAALAPASAASSAPAPTVAAPPRSAARRPIRRLLLLALLAGALGAGGWYGHRWWTEGRFLVGTDDAYVQGDVTVLAAKVTGYVAAVEVASNQAVRTGDVVARIDDGDYRLARQAARDRLATQEGTVARIGRQIEAAAADAASAAAGLDAARAEAVWGESEFARQSELSRSDYASRARLDEATAARDRSRAAVRRAEADLASERAGVEVLRAQAIEAERAAGELRTALAKAERDLGFTVVRAPVDGIVGNKAVQVGSYVQPGTRLAALVPLGSVYVDANFKETQLARIRLGQRVRLSVDAFDGRRFEGTVASIAPASGSVFSLLPPENATGNFTKIVQRVPVRIAIAPEVLAERILRPGLSVLAEVDTRTGGPAAPPAAAAVGPP